MSGKNGKKIEHIPGAEMVGEKMQTQNPGIPEITKVQVGARCTLAMPVSPAHNGNPCSFCGKKIKSGDKPEACPKRSMIVGHFNKIFKLSAIRDGGETLILKRVR